jgi:hypothetical protein
MAAAGSADSYHQVHTPKEPTMLSRLLATSADVQSRRIFWVVVSTLALAQLAAFWLLCSHQVRKAEVRDATLQVQRVAISDCLQYIPHATLHRCAARVDPAAQDDGNVLAGMPGNAVPVNYAWR